jgi:hypothetical protein
MALLTSVKDPFILSATLFLLDTVTSRSQWPRGLRSLERWDRGFESHSRHGCLCALILSVLFCVQLAAL